MKREPTTEAINSRQRIKYLIDTFCDGSQQVFADKVKIGKSSVSQYVNGTNCPGNIRARQIGDVFGVNPVWVMGFEVPMTDTPDPLFFPAYILMELTRDKEMMNALSKYITLSPEKKKGVVDMINLLGQDSD